MFDNVHLLHTSSSSELFEQMVRISEEDVIIGISFPRYSMRTLKAMEFANNRNAKVITLTDSVHSPMTYFLQSDCKKRYGIYCGFPGGSAECDQRTDRRPVHEKAE